MALPCGCEFHGGEPVSPETLKEHFDHTFKAMVIWELIKRPGPGAPVPNQLAEARVAYIGALEKAFPEVKEER